MSTPKDLHRKAMVLVNEAMGLKNQNDLVGYLNKMKAALPLEVEAARFMRDHKEAEPTRSVLCLGAANLAFTCGETALAKEMINIAFAGTPPAALHRELEVLQRSILNSEVAFDGQSYTESEYLVALREKAVHLRIEPVLHAHSHAVPLDYALFGLTKCKASWNAYLTGSFLEEFGVEEFGDRTEVIIGAMRKEAPLLIVGLNFKSFGVSLASDAYVMHHTNLPRIEAWRKKVFDSFKEDVIEVDYHSKAEVDRIIKRYDERQRREVYGPMIAMFRGTSPFRVSLTDKHFTQTVRTFSAVPQKTIERITPTPTNKQEQTLVLFRVFGMAPEEGTGSIRKQDIIQSDELETAEMKREIERIVTPDGSLELKTPIEIKIVYTRPFLSIDDGRFGLSIVARDNHDLMDQFHRHMLTTYDRLSALADSDFSDMDRLIKESFDEHVFSRNT